MPFASIVGHQGVVALLRQAAARSRVPQSLLFAGPEGVGKRTVAVALAQAVNCPNRKDGDACGRCPTCTRIERNQFSDVVYLDTGGEATIKIQALRQRILDAVGYRPFEGARRVFIIDPADALTDQAQDALLKTLEEPPPASILILISAYADVLFPTIRSRCRRVRFGALTEADVSQVLVDRAGLGAREASTRAAASAGSVARALSLDSDEFAEDRAAALALIDVAARNASMPDRLKVSATFSKHAAKRRAREAALTRLAILSTMIRDLGAVRADSGSALSNADLMPDLMRMANAFPVGRLSQNFALVTEATEALERNASPKIVADWLAVSL